MPFCITMGDPRGVGPDLILLTHSKNSLPADAVIYGFKSVFESRSKLLGLSFNLDIIEPQTDCAPFDAPGLAAFSCLESAVDAMNAGLHDYMVTCPINKEAMQKDGFEFPGHTEYLAARTGTENYHMMLAGDALRVVLVTIHEPISRLPSLITESRVKSTIEAAIQTCKIDYGIKSPRIAVCGFNPHCGEGGLFGDEETNFITPAIKILRNRYAPDVLIDGPLSADTIFWKAMNGNYDVIVAMYHDQGLATVKTIDFHTTVNITLGLPWVRTSPDHGTAFDIAGLGTVDTSSFLSAIKVGAQMSGNRKNGIH